MPRPPTGRVIELRRQRGIVYALRFQALDARQYVTLGTRENGWTRARAEDELKNVLALVRMGKWELPALAAAAPLEPAAEPIFWDFARDWVERRAHEVEARTVEHWQWALNTHLEDSIGKLYLSEITVQRVDELKTSMLLEQRLGAGSINKVLKVLAQILDDACEYGLLKTNPARGKKRRLKAPKPRRTWLELDEVGSLLDAAEGSNRALLATMTLAGLRVSETTALRWRALDLARGTMTVEKSKTAAGEGRKIDLTPMLLDELKAHKANADAAAPADLVFPTSKGTEQDRANVGSRVLGGAIAAANAKRAKVYLPPIQEGVTNHTLRRTFASLLYEAGASPAYVMSQMGHTSSALALEIYAKKMERSRDTGARIDALIKAADWPQPPAPPAEELHSDVA